MNILYAIQGTGNGHISRAIEIIPYLQKDHSVDILISGLHSDISLPFPITYKYKGLGFIFGKKGGVDLLSTYRKNNIKTLFKEINMLPIEKYDLVISDFEPVSAWACYQKNKKCVGLSNQVAVLNKKAPKARKPDLLGTTILKRYAPTKVNYGFHFQSYTKNIYTPIIRKQIREQEVTDAGHYTVYLPAYNNERIIKVLSRIENTRWQVFSKHFTESYTLGNISIEPIDNENFVKSMASSRGVLCGAGFATPTEALFMKKKLMVIPMQGQYEQQCNAEALRKMGVNTINSLKLQHLEIIKNWVSNTGVIEVNYPDITEKIISNIFKDHQLQAHEATIKIEKKFHSIKHFRKTLLRKIMATFLSF